MREPGDPGDVPTGRAAKFLQLQQEVIKQDFFTWENMKYLEKPNLAPRGGTRLRGPAPLGAPLLPGTEPSPHDFGYTADGAPDPAAAGCRDAQPDGGWPDQRDPIVRRRRIHRARRCWTGAPRNRRPR